MKKKPKQTKAIEYSLKKIEREREKKVENETISKRNWRKTRRLGKVKISPRSSDVFEKKMEIKWNESEREREKEEEEKEKMSRLSEN